MSLLIIITIFFYLQILLIGCGDLGNSLWTVGKLTEAYKEVNFHIQDGYDTVVARDILIVHIMVAEDFDPDSPEDLQYLWDIWYSLQWSEKTRKRFVKDVKLLLAGPFHPIIKIPNTKYLKKMKMAFKSWLDATCNLKLSTISNNLYER